jgi:hypothetical protein
VPTFRRSSTGRRGLRRAPTPRYRLRAETTGAPAIERGRTSRVLTDAGRPKGNSPRPTQWREGRKLRREQARSGALRSIGAPTDFRPVLKPSMCFVHAYYYLLGCRSACPGRTRRVWRQHDVCRRQGERGVPRVRTRLTRSRQAPASARASGRILEPVEWSPMGRMGLAEMAKSDRSMGRLASLPAIAYGRCSEPRPEGSPLAGVSRAAERAARLANLARRGGRAARP